jgi:hypothetical protein
MYADDRFCRLTPTKASGQTLWIYLLTGPFSTLIPGIIVGGEAGMSEALRWPLPAFRRRFREIAEQGMALADWRARVVFLPKALRHNPPQSPSVITGWRQAWAEVPACDLKREAAGGVRAFLSRMGPAYLHAFEEFARCGTTDTVGAQPVSQAVGQPGGQSGPHQDQEQDQEQDVPPTPLPVLGAARTPGPLRGHPLDERRILEPWALDAFEQFMAEYPRPEARKRALDVWRELNPTPELVGVIMADVRRRVAAGWGTEPQFVPFPAKYLDERRWQERPSVLPRIGPATDRALDGLTCMRPCPECGAVQEGRYQGGQKVFAPCHCLSAAKVGA